MIRSRADPSFTMSYPHLAVNGRAREFCSFLDREFFRGGARRDRTDDLMLAKHALYQLSYGPLGKGVWEGRSRFERYVVGPGRFELPTSRLSGVRSNQLSYGPPEAAGLERSNAKSRSPVRIGAPTPEPEGTRDRIAGLQHPSGAASDKGKEKRRRRHPAPV